MRAYCNSLQSVVQVIPDRHFSVISRALQGDMQSNAQTIHTYKDLPNTFALQYRSARNKGSTITNTASSPFEAVAREAQLPDPAPIKVYQLIHRGRNVHATVGSVVLSCGTGAAAAAVALAEADQQKRPAYYNQKTRQGKQCHGKRYRSSCKLEAAAAAHINLLLQLQAAVY
jgi:hypothetical protein